MTIKELVVETADAVERSGDDGDARRGILNAFRTAHPCVDYEPDDVVNGLRDCSGTNMLLFLWMTVAVSRPSILYRGVFERVIETQEPMFALEWVLVCVRDTVDEYCLDVLKKFLCLDSDDYEIGCAKKVAVEALINMSADGSRAAHDFVVGIVEQDSWGLGEFTRDILGV